jgi:phage regulator Rha-like protein
MRKSHQVRKSKISVPLERVEKAICMIRGEKVILDTDLATLYGVTTTRLNEQVKRNADRFPEDFAFRLTKDEFEILMSQIATSRTKHGGRRKLPLVFTEHGAIMAANVLSSKRAVQASVQVVRAFVRLRQILASNAELASKLTELERKYDRQFKFVFDAIRQLMAPPAHHASRSVFEAVRNEESAAVNVSSGSPDGRWFDVFVPGRGRSLRAWKLCCGGCRGLWRCV